jgi:hypothetical protein
MAVVIMMTAALAFALQCAFVAVSEAATGDTSHYYLGFVFGAHDGSYVVIHRHADGTIHQHIIDDDDDALAKHVKEPGWNMALVTCVLPCAGVAAIFELAGSKLTMEGPPILRVADLNGLRRPPRPPSIA